MIQAVIAADRPPCRGIVHLWNLDATAPDGLDVATLLSCQEAGLFSIVGLVQAWDRIAPDRSAPLFLVTRGAQSVGDRPEPSAVAQAPVVGLGRVIAGEYPRLRCKLVDLDPHADDGGAGSLFDEIQSDDGEDEVAWRASERYVHRYLPAPGLPPEGERGSTPCGEPYRLALRRAGTLDGLALQTVRRRPPGPGEVEIEVVAAGLNFSDVMKALGMYPGLPDGPVPLGAECSGRITAIGEGVDGFRLGDEVLAVAGFAFGSHVVTRAELVAVKPARIGFEEAATLPIAFLTASYALEYLGRLGPGERVLIHAASGGVGLAAVQLARRAGAEVFATAGTPEKREYLRALGVGAVMDSRSLDFADEVRRLTDGRGVDLILNSLAGEAIERGLGCLADYGRFLEIGKRDIYQNARLGLRPFHKNLSFFAIDLDRVIRERPAPLGSMLREIVRSVADGELSPLPHQAWPIAEASDAFRFMQQGKHIGKLVISPRGQTLPAVPAEDEPLTFRADASYLITGGLGGFGLAVARWMAGRGAGTLVLMGRRGAARRRGPRGRRRAGTARRPGRRPQRRRVEGRGRGGGPRRDRPRLAAAPRRPPRGDGPGRRLAREPRPRPDGAGARAEGERGLEPARADGRTPSGSLRPVLLAVERLRASRPGQLRGGECVPRRPRLVSARPRPARAGGQLGSPRRGRLPLPPRRAGRAAGAPGCPELHRPPGVGAAREGHAAAARPGQRDAGRVVAMARAGRDRPDLAAVPHLCRPTGQTLRDGRPAAAGPWAATIRAASGGDRPALVGSLLHDKLARVLGMSPDRLDGDKPLLQLGIDSLMAVELRNWLESELRVDLPIVELMRSPCVSGLAEQLAERLEAGGNAPPRDVGRNGTANGSANGHHNGHVRLSWMRRRGGARPGRGPLQRPGRCPPGGTPEREWPGCRTVSGCLKRKGSPEGGRDERS